MNNYDILSCRNETDILNLLNSHQWKEINFYYLCAFSTTFAITFFTPLWSLILFYLHIPVIIIYFTGRFIGKQVGFEYNDSDPLTPLRNFFGHVWTFVGKHWHGYSIIGEENIPRKGPAIFVAYHGAFGLDLYYFCSKFMVREKGKVIQPVVHRSFQNMAAWDVFVKVVSVVPGTQANCIDSLKKGNLILLAPGGSYEALISDQETYRLEWQNKSGFARVALQAKAPIIPIFTENIRESYRVPTYLKKIFVYLRKIFSYPIPPVYGGFPVKLTTHVGKPIPYDSSLTPEALAQKTVDAMEELIRRNQRIPGCVWSAMMDRFPCNKLSCQ